MHSSTAGLGLFCMLASVVLMIFVEIAQISSHQTVLRHIRMTTIDTTNFGVALAAAGAQTSNLYGTGVRTGDNQGLRRFYEYGQWSACEGNNKGSTDDAYCFPTSWGFKLDPASLILADVPSSLQSNVQSALPSNLFTDSSYLGKFSRATFYLLFIGTLCGGVSLLLGFVAHRFAFLLSAILGLLTFLLLGVGAAIYTIVIHRVKNALGGATLGGDSLGITASYGNALWLTWAATLAALLSVIPFTLACCFGRGSTHDDYLEEEDKY